MKQKKKRVFQKVETLTLLTHAISEFTPGSNTPLNRELETIYD